MSTARGSTSVLCIQHPDHLAELLAMMYGCTKFNQYFHGKKEEVQSDHKPLMPCLKKKKNIISGTAGIATNDVRVTAL